VSAGGGARPAVLVTGATGYVGGRLVPRLLARGIPVRCLVRDPSRLDVRRWQAAAKDGARLEVVAGDALRPETLEPAFAGCRAAYYLIHSMAAGERGFAERDARAARNVSEAARSAGLERLIYLGGLGDAASSLSEHLCSRHETGVALRSAGIPVTELRAAVVVGSGSASFEMIRYLVERIPVLVAPRWTATRCQPIAVRDVLDYLIAALDEPAARGRTIDVGGADVLTYGDMMLGYARVRGLRRFVLNVPVLTPRLSSLWVDLVTPIPAAIARPLIEGLRTEVVVGDDTARRLFPAIHPIAYAEAVRLALARQHENAVETHWSDSSSSARDRAPARVDFTQQEGLIIERRERDVAASPEHLWQVASSLGGRTGWLYADRLWDLRGLLDRLCGGPGKRRGRRDPRELRAGDACDFWRVIDVQPGRRLLFGAEMRVPGRAWLELSVAPREGGARLAVAAVFEPRGLAGLVYWWALYPLHALIFDGLVRRLAQRAEALALRPGERAA
jgi:uncharacterized protein YbjT (DUF2867 family)